MTILNSPLPNSIRRGTASSVSVRDATKSPPPSPFASLPAIPPSYFKPLCHPLVDQVSKEVDGYFAERWNFQSPKAKEKFLATGFSRLTCLWFPKALDDRIHLACRLVTVLFLIDDILEDLLFEEGSLYYDKLIAICRGDSLPDRSVPAEYIMLLSALMRFSMGLKITPQELETVKPIEKNCAKHISVINGIYSYEELLVSKTAHEEGGAFCTSVQIMMGEMDVDAESTKRILFAMCREREFRHRMLVAQLKEESDDTMKVSSALPVYVQGLEYQVSGNEAWCSTSPRYKVAAQKNCQ
ncbi:hypothetical protein VTN00DRAFT_7999 [Thermoascus crustaceus]|uniref:uncharacterized protein n=1 Tax=Thermoascus crustaceus TaxID=5088 RepID=UPI003742D23C